MSHFHKIFCPKGEFTMITTDDVLNMNFYKKETFTGSYQGMRYRLKKETEEIPADEPDAAPTKRDYFLCHIWPGPYNFATTPEEKKLSATFPFTVEGKQEAVNWMNEQWEKNGPWNS